MIIALPILILTKAPVTLFLTLLFNAINIRSTKNNMYFFYLNVKVLMRSSSFNKNHMPGKILVLEPDLSYG